MLNIKQLSDTTVNPRIPINHSSKFHFIRMSIIYTVNGAVFVCTALSIPLYTKKKIVKCQNAVHQILWFDYFG